MALNLNFSKLPITPQSDPLEEFLKEVNTDIKYLDNHYSNIQDMLGDAFKGAMSWVPQTITGKQTPNPKNLYQLAVQLLAVCYVNKRNGG